MKFCMLNAKYLDIVLRIASTFCDIGNETANTEMKTHFSSSSKHGFQRLEDHYYVPLFMLDRVFTSMGSANGSLSS